MWDRTQLQPLLKVLVEAVRLEPNLPGRDHLTRQAARLNTTPADRTSSVVISRLHDYEFVVAEFVDEAVFLGDAARPVARQVV